MVDALNETAVFLQNFPFKQLILDDVQALLGGWRIVIGGDGTAVIEKVAAGGRVTKSEQRVDINRFHQLLVEIDFMTIVIPDRAGVADEARPVITVVNGNCRSHTVAKWDNDTHARFDAIYEALLALLNVPFRKD
ncbi:MAG: hypothetical protein GY796_31300 [Chloroflexi bacterium]|nr:hypothetical protein [Chloroflexota bacterium]